MRIATAAITEPLQKERSSHMVVFDDNIYIHSVFTMEKKIESDSIANQTKKLSQMQDKSI